MTNDDPVCCPWCGSVVPAGEECTLPEDAENCDNFTGAS